MSNYIFAFLLFVAGLVLLKITFIKVQDSFTFPAISFGPKGIRIPKLLLLKLELISSNELEPRLLIRKDNLIIVIICAAGIASELFDLGLKNTFYEPTLRFLNFIVLIISVIKIIFGIDLTDKYNGQKSDSEIVTEISNLLSASHITIRSWKDFSENFKYFAHLLPVIEQDEEINMKDLVISLANVNIKKDFRSKAFKEIQAYIQSHTGIMPIVPIPMQNKRKYKK